ncbi:MAG: hypothetical protein J6A62_06210 [Oscillospiraceae bacterium]|nr:hypothetical protein [Oscillospiraceae bacterium]
MKVVHKHTIWYFSTAFCLWQLILRKKQKNPAAGGLRDLTGGATQI